MKYLPLIWAGLWRKKLRTVLTLLAIMVAFLLFGLLQGVNTAFTSGVQGAHLNRLFIQARVSFTESLPSAYLSRIERVPGVTAVAYESWFGGYYQDPKNFVFSFPTDIARLVTMYPEFVVEPEQMDAMIHTRTGAIVGRALAEKYGWHIGDHVPLKSSIWTIKANNSSDWAFDIVGIYTMPSNRMGEQNFFINHDFFDEARAIGRGTYGWYIAEIDDPAHAAAIGAAIDALFANSDNETRTVTEKEQQQSFLKQYGDINFIVSAIITAVFFTLLFLTGNTMMQSVRERIPEFAVLKTLGFSDNGVLALVLFEGLILAVLASVLGLAAASAVFPLAQSVIGVAQLPPSVIEKGLGYAVGLAVVTGVIPGLRVRRLRIVDALAGR